MNFELFFSLLAVGITFGLASFLPLRSEAVRVGFLIIAMVLEIIAVLIVSGVVRT